MQFRNIILGFALAVVLFSFHLNVMAQTGEGDPAVLAKMHEINEQLRAMGLDIAIESIEFFTIGKGRPSIRIHQRNFRWVPYDERRDAQGEDITYLVDQSDGATASGLTNAQTEAAIDRAMDTWSDDKCFQKVNLVKRPDTGDDPDITDFFFGYGGFGNPFLADIVHAGWLPKGFFDAVGGPGAGHSVLAINVNYIFRDGGEPTDINDDGYLDLALSEIYYNDNFGNPSGTRSGYPWGINVPQPGVDVETVALHESGHAFCLGHFGPPPKAVMNPVYMGMRQKLSSSDHSGFCTVWSAWPYLED